MAGRRIVIIGGGVMGCSTAYWLTREPAFTGEILVLERDPTYQTASSALSASGIRQQFSTAVNIELSRASFAFLQQAEAELAVGGEPPALSLCESSYLYLASAAGLPALQANHGLQRSLGAEVALLTPAELASRFPWLNTDDLAAGSLGLRGEGWLDGYALMRAFRRAAAARGAVFQTAEVTAIRTVGGAVSAVIMDGAEIACDAVVNAAGPWAAKVAAMAGLDLPVHARRRSVFVIETPDPLPGCPLVIDPSGFWLRPEGNGFITGAPPAPADDGDDLPLDPDVSLFEETIWPALAHRVPSLERLRLRSAWAGYYEINSVDYNGIVGMHPALVGFYLANGFSGHGLQQSPAVGRGLAELIATGRYRTLDLRPLGIERLLEGRPLLERNVI